MKHLSLNKYLKLGINLILISGFVMLIVGGIATYRQTDMNSPLFLEDDRMATGFGVLFAIIAWGSWDFFASAKKTSPWAAYTSIVSLIIATVLINGILGLIFGGIAIAIAITLFVLIVQKTQINLGNGFKQFGNKISKGGKR